MREALDLCLACKACRAECPVNVDMATYKAEFLHHHYRGRLRPRAAYSMGLIRWWAALASAAPRAANAFARGRATGALLRRLGGIHPARRIPPLADRTFRAWFEARDGAPAGGRAVILWPDTFTNHFRPEVGRAAVEVLERLGFRPVLPPGGLCCGRPLYDHGMLRLARRELRRVLDALRDEIRAGTPVVGLEPSCVATFRDELVNLFPDDRDARRLAGQTLILSELIDRHAPHADLGGLDGRSALLHGHCHHRSVLDFGSEERVLRRTGLDVRVLDSGCCGMAGSFGFDARHYDVSQACAERVLLPAVRDADGETLIITGGFSCREQLEQNGMRAPLHPAQVLATALREAASRIG